MDDVISSLKIIATSDTSNASSSIVALGNALKTLKSSTNSKTADGLIEISRSIKMVQWAVNEEAISKLERLASALERLKATSKINLKISGNISQIEEATKSSKTPKGGAGGSGESKSGSGTDPKKDKEETWKEFSKKWDEEYGTSGGKETSSKESTQSLLSSLGKSKFLSSITRIAMYRAIRAAIMKVAQALSEGYKSAVAWAKENNGSLYQSTLKITAATSTMKNQLGSMSGELIQTIQPALIYLAELVGDVADKLAQAFATMRGSDTYQKAKVVTEDMAEAASELNKALLGMDEINKLNFNSSIIGGSDAFEEATVNKTDAAIGTTITMAIMTAFGFSTALKLASVLQKVLTVCGVGKAASTSMASALNTALSTILPPAIITEIAAILQLVANLKLKELNDKGEAIDPQLLLNTHTTGKGQFDKNYEIWKKSVTYEAETKMITDGIVSPYAVTPSTSPTKEITLAPDINVEVKLGDSTLENYLFNSTFGKTMRGILGK